MASLSTESDEIKISKTDVRILVALLKDRAAGYELASRLQTDLGGTEYRSWNSPIYRSLKSLEALQLITVVPTDKLGSGGASRQVYDVTSLGLRILETEVVHWEALIALLDHRRPIFIARSQLRHQVNSILKGHS